jgi:1-acyl-sn-glycerol-3-phosphate acyltransferase
MQPVMRLISIIIATFALYIITHLLVLLLIPAAFLITIFGKKHTVHGFKKFFASAVFTVIGKEVRVTGLDKIDQAEKYLVICNYPSGYVTFALMKYLPSISFVADDFIAKIPIVGYFLKQAGTIFVDQRRPRKSKAAIDNALNDPNRDIHYLLIYPEGKRTINGKIDRFKYGFKYILRHSRLNVLPVTANGFYQLKPVRRVYLDPHADLEIIFHEPIESSAIGEMSNQELIIRIEETVGRDYRP